jgi:hypothetical protein
LMSSIAQPIGTNIHAAVKARRNQAITPLLGMFLRQLGRG